MMIFPVFVSVPPISPGSLNLPVSAAVLQPGAVIASWCQAASSLPLNSATWGG